MARFNLIVLMLIYSISTSFAQLSSVKVSSSTLSLGQNGVYYSLPRVVIQIDVLVAKITDVPGPYSSYAQQVLGLTDFIDHVETNYSIKGVHLNSFTEADPNAIYFLNLGERSTKTERSFLLHLQANGVLKGMNESSPVNQEDRKDKIEIREDYFSHDFNYYADLNQVVHVDTIIRRIAVDTTSIEDVIYNRTLAEKSRLERAQDAANSYMDIHKKRFELLVGYQEVNYPEQTIALMNNELRKMEADYLALFKGKRFISEEKFSFYLIPEGDKPNQTYPIFKFSKDRGVADLTASYGERVVLVVQTNGVTDVFKNQTVLTQTSGIFYRIPETARVWVDYNNTVYSKNTFLLPQLGVLQSVNTDKTIFSVDAKTGMLKAIEIK